MPSAHLKCEIDFGVRLCNDVVQAIPLSAQIFLDILAAGGSSGRPMGTTRLLAHLRHAHIYVSCTTYYPLYQNVPIPISTRILDSAPLASR